VVQNRRDWPAIAMQLNGRRTGKQCRQRYSYHLQAEFKTGGWTPEEDKIIIDEQARGSVFCLLVEEEYLQRTRC
jgi:hypothetical protein